eukprot:CAMPEP_0181320426 /NCGR_PEP_ID=MMETSP1101-20121128/18119_1 /TAXON_ID=46948 /ORGANISM="Rhodomonas abbreviata, Strain Caron Lab Isolate" /LENGTH=902 /DNA_ID=CAMNT_0023428133 /DNA_START=268 /DNA_END=2974 /DNA_ORIENTATION=+
MSVHQTPGPLPPAARGQMTPNTYSSPQTSRPMQSPYNTHTPPQHGDPHDALVSELMHEVETKRSELENMTMSVVQWKQSFKDKLQTEKLELQREVERADSARALDRNLLTERMSLRMLTLHGRLVTAVAFQKLREHRKQVLWLQRVKELKNQCETLREEASIAAANSLSASHQFSQTEFAQRIVTSLSHLQAIAQGHDVDVEGGWILSDIISVGNAVVGEKLRQLLTVIQHLKGSETTLQRKTADLSGGNSAVAQLQERVALLERELHAKRKAVESLSMQLDIERDSARDSRRSSPRASAASSRDNNQIDILQREVQMLSETKMKMDEDKLATARKVTELEESNNTKQLVNARREMELSAADRRSLQALEQDQRKDAEIIRTLSSLREGAERKAQSLSEDLHNQSLEMTKLRDQAEAERRRSRMMEGQMGSGPGIGLNSGSDLLQLIQLRAAAEKRAEEAEAGLKQEQHNVWKLRQEFKMMEARMSESGTRSKSESQSSANSPKMHPRDSQSSVMSGQSTTPTSFELQRLQRELKVMAELKEAALQSLDSLRAEMVDGVTNIEFSHLRIDSKIGSGSFAEVYRGEWTRPCAIKKLRGLTRRRQLQDFYREAQILQMLNHSGVVQLMGICMNIPELYLVTELVVGGSLEDLLHIEKRKLTSQELLSIAMQIADAMQFLHMANIVHRDLKPSNCLIDHNGVVKLCDFGLARVMTKELQPPQRAGTPVYLAPEALQGAPTTHKVDIYSFAVICWEMLTGQQAWVSLDYKQMVAAVLRDRRRPPFPADIKADWRALVDSCWGQDPNDRPSFTSIVVSLSEMGAPKPARQSKSTPFKNVELVKQVEATWRGVSNLERFKQVMQPAAMKAGGNSSTPALDMLDATKGSGSVCDSSCKEAEKGRGGEAG